MKAVFIETGEFTAWISEYLPDETYSALQRELMANPEKGTPMPGCGGLRKIRTHDPRRGQGKRGGARGIFMKTRPPRKPPFDRLKQGLEEGVAQAKGELTLRTVVMPDAPPEIDAETLVALRAQSAMSQSVFARMLNVSTKTVQGWEQGLRQPSEASRRLIQIYSEHPKAVCQSVGLPPVTLKGVTIVNIAPGHRKIIIRDDSAARKVLRNKTKTPR